MRIQNTQYIIAMENIGLIYDSKLQYIKKLILEIVRGLSGSCSHDPFSHVGDTPNPQISTWYISTSTKQVPSASERMQALELYLNFLLLC